MLPALDCLDDGARYWALKSTSRISLSKNHLKSFTRKMLTPFRYYLRVRYGECDAQKVVFNARYAEYVDLATTEFLRALGYGEQLFSGELDFQLVKQTIEWKAPARFDQVLEVSVYARNLGNTSFVLGAEFRIAGDERLIVTAETVYVLVKQHTLAKTPVPPDLRAALQQGAAGLTTDHAGYFSDNAQEAGAAKKH
jgi:acyl-CoA thioester hydrolase